jgi:hypothetical protein
MPAKTLADSSHAPHNPILANARKILPRSYVLFTLGSAGFEFNPLSKTKEKTGVKR